MALQDSLLKLASKVISVISLRNIVLWTFAAVVVLLAYTAFQNRAAIIGLITIGKPEVLTPPVTSIVFTVSDTTKLRVKQLVDTNDLINSVSVLNVDLRNNTRIPLSWYSDDISIQRSLDSLYTQAGTFPLFTSDIKNNETIVRVINGEFSCGGFEETGAGNVLPGLQARAPYICRASLPPYYGQFTGYILITLNRVATESEKEILRSSLTALSSEIFFRDVLPKNRELGNPIPSH